MDKNMKIEEGFTFLTEAGDLLFIYKKFKNGKMYAYEISNGVEEIEYTYDEEDILIGKDSSIVYSVIDNNNKIIKDQTSFYFNEKYAKGVVCESNKFAGKNKKPYKYKKMYLIDADFYNY